MIVCDFRPNRSHVLDLGSLLTERPKGRKMLQLSFIHDFSLFPKLIYIKMWIYGYSSLPFILSHALLRTKALTAFSASYFLLPDR